MKPPRVFKPLVVWLIVGLGVAAKIVPLAFAQDRVIGEKALTELEYKREVLGYCGLSDPLAVKGFLQRKRELIRKFLLDEQAQFDAMSDARQAAYAEWQNRGLGGFRGWCREEGSDYTSRLKSYLNSG